MTKSSPSESVATQTEIQPVPQGWLSYVPSPFVPYLQLMRLDRPNGYWYFWLPHFYGTLHAARQQKSSPLDLLRVNLILLWGVLIMRGATCTWNDTVDAPFDALVTRCKNRPVARGAVSVTQAHMFTAFQTFLSLWTLKFLPPLCLIYAVPAIVGWIIYPLGKRVTYYPQVILGFPMAWGIFMGAASMGADPLSLSNLYSALTDGFDLRGIWLALPNFASQDLSLWAFYGANALWTLLYEIIYSHQDAKEDIKAGVKNIVLLYADTTDNDIKFGTMPLLYKLGIGQILLLGASGALGDKSSAYFVGTVAGAAATTATVLSKVDLHNPESCAWWFKVGCCKSTGGMMAAGLIADYIIRILDISL